MIMKSKKILIMAVAFLMTFAPLNNFAFATEEEVETVNESTSEQTEQAPNLWTPVQKLDFGTIDGAGRSYTRTVTLSNNTSAEMGVDLAVESYKNDTLANEWKVADSWIVFVGGKTHYTIPANSNADIDVRMAIPDDVKGGTYYATVTATAGEDSVSIPVLVTLTTDGYKVSGELIKNSVQFLSHGNFGDEVIAVVKNTGTARFCVKSTFRYANLLGLEEWTDAGSSSDCIAQGETLELKPNTNSVTRYDKYGLKKVEQKVYYYNADGVLTESFLKQNVMYVPAGAEWIGLGIVSFIAVLIIVIVIIRKKRKSGDEKTAAEEEL